MNGSRSNTPTYGSKSSLDQLNRTIEGLEARIQGLMTEKSAPARHSATSPVDEIIERQRSLGNTRDRVSALMERGRTEPARSNQQPAWTEPQARPAVAQVDPALGEIAATLSALRSELKQGLGDNLQSGFGELRNEMRNLRSSAANPAGLEVVRDELALLAQSIGKLEVAGRPQDIGNLHADLDELRAMLSGVAREDSVRHLEKRWDSTQSALAAINPDAVKEELLNLAWRIDGLKSGLGELSAAPAVRALEDKLIAVANAVEKVGRNVESQTRATEQFAGLEQRLDEISRAIAATQRQGSVLDTSMLQRVEQRINDLVDHIGALPQTNPADEMAARIEELTIRIEEMANEDAARKLEERIAKLSTLVESSLDDRAAAPGLDRHLADISRKIDGLGSNGAADLIERLEMLSRKIDEIEQPAPAAAHVGDSDAMIRLESRLADIAARLDETALSAPSDTSALQNLERQITGLSALINQPGNMMQASALPEGFDRRMGAIEDYIASSDEFIVEAARQAAETVVEAYARGGQTNSAMAPDMAALAGLADDLRSLEAHTRSSEERTQATFEALHETLVQIAGRLNDIGTTAPAPKYEPAPVYETASAAPVRETRERLMETVAMPKAPQPDFSATNAMLEPAAPSRKPDHPKVDVFDEAELGLQSHQPSEEPITPPVAEAKTKDAKASKSLIAGLAARLKPAKKERVAIEPAPALDPGNAVVADEPNLLLEPGAGVPDVKKILEKVRNGQQAGKRDAAPMGSPNDMIAAARRAAQAAAAEAGAQKLAQPSAFKKPGEKKESKSLFAGLGESRRPILLAAGAILLVAMSYPLVSNLVSGGNTEAAPEQIVDSAAPAVDESKAAIPAEQPAAVAEQPAATDAVPVDAATETTTDATTTETTPATEAKPLSAAETLMQPAETAETATTLEKPASETRALDQNAAALPTFEEATADPSLSANTDAAMPAPADAAPEIALPAGLQPASLVDAARKGDALALFEIGARYTDGRGVKVDLAEAAKWYALASDKGMAPAQYRLANLYEKGTGVTRDVEKAKSLYNAAADKGNASAMHNLAVLMATGVGGTPDFGLAAKWFEKAAAFNVRDSQFNLAILYAQGNGVQQDLEESYKWFAIAAREGDQDAAQKRDQVANALSPDQLKSAKAKFDLWKPIPMDDATNTPMVPDEWIAKGNTTATIDVKRAIRNIQAILNNNGFDAGKADGEMGKKTVTAIKAFQKSVGQEPSGKITDALVKELLARNKKG